MALQGETLLKLCIKLPSTQRSIQIEALSSDTIARTRSMIVAKGVAPKEQYNLFYLGQKLDQNKTLAHFKIVDRSTLHAIIIPREELTIFVKVDGKTLRLKLHALYTVQDAKSVVESTVGSSLVDQLLFFEKKKLESAKTLSYYCIKENSILEMVLPKVSIFIRNVCGSTSTITLCVDKHDLIEEVKSEIFSRLKIPVQKQVLWFRNKKLDDRMSLGDYNIQRDSTLNLTTVLLTRYCKKRKALGIQINR